jgi:hypothetical protein
MVGDQARIVAKFHAGLTATQKWQLREICGAAIRDMQGRRRMFESLRQCSGMDAPLQTLHSEIGMLSKLTRLLNAMAA